MSHPWGPRRKPAGEKGNRMTGSVQRRRLRPGRRSVENGLSARRHFVKQILKSTCGCVLKFLPNCRPAKSRGALDRSRSRALWEYLKYYLKYLDCCASHKSTCGSNQRYQIWQRSFSGRTIGSPGLHLYAFAKAGIFESGPFTRKCGNGCGSTLVSRRLYSGRMLPAHTCA